MDNFSVDTVELNVEMKNFLNNPRRRLEAGVSGIVNKVESLLGSPEAASTRNQMEVQATTAYLSGGLSREVAGDIVKAGVGRFLAYKTLREVMGAIPTDSGIRTAIDARSEEMQQYVASWKPEQKESVLAVLEKERETFSKERPEFAAVLGVVKRFVAGDLDEEEGEVFKGILMVAPIVDQAHRALMEGDNKLTLKKVLMLPFLGNRKDKYVGARMISTLAVVMDQLVPHKEAEATKEV